MMRVKFAAPIIIIMICLLSSLTLALTAAEYYDKAILQYLVGDFDGALKNLDEALKADPDFSGAAELKSTILREKGLAPLGLSARPKTESKEEVIRRYLMAGRDNLIKGNYQKSIGYFKGVLILNPQNREAADYLREAERKEIEAASAAHNKILTSYLWFLLYLWAGILILPALAVYLAREIKKIRGRTRRCFNCQAKISRSIDQCPNCGAWLGTKMQASISRTQRLWHRKIGWKKNPFTLDIHPELFTGYHNEVKQILEKISSKSGHILITGPLGAGKTTLLRWLSNQLVVDAHTVYVPRPPQEFSQLIKVIIETIGGYHKKAQEYDIYHLYELRKKMNKPLIILLDEAHEFTIEIEKPLRTLGDLDDVKLVMAGLPETIEKFKTEIRPLYERMVLNIELKQLDFDSFKELVKVRIEAAGGEGIAPFTDGAIKEIYELAKGLPRTGIKACDSAVTRAIESGEVRIANA